MYILSKLYIDHMLIIFCMLILNKNKHNLFAWYTTFLFLNATFDRWSRGTGRNRPSRLPWTSRTSRSGFPILALKRLFRSFSGHLIVQFILISWKKKKSWLNLSRSGFMSNMNSATFHKLVSILFDICWKRIHLFQCNAPKIIFWFWS